MQLHSPAGSAVNSRQISHRQEPRPQAGTSSDQKKSGEVNGALYSRFASAYDLIFSSFLAEGIRRSIRSLDIPAGARVLDVGIGTGAYLDAFPTDATVTGVDRSSDMLRRARNRVRENSWSHVRLSTADAESLPFEDHQFDLVTAFHSLTAMSNPGRALREMCRVCSTQGQIVLVGQFTSRDGWWPVASDCIDSITRRVGWHSNVPLNELMRSISATVTQERRRLFPLVTEVVIEPHRETACCRENQPLVHEAATE